MMASTVYEKEISLGAIVSLFRVDAINSAICSFKFLIE